MNVIRNSKCKIEHSGFWHGECLDQKCKPGKCVCNNCGGGCVYKNSGMKGHWSCCTSENFDSKCTLLTDFMITDEKMQ